MTFQSLIVDFMKYASFFLSTGRCGTQWLARNLGQVFPDRAVVAHEPLYIQYMPRWLLGLGDPLDAHSSGLIRQHMENIRRTLEIRDYIECGWPCYGAIPYFAHQFDGCCRVIHLTRHPVFTASSMVTHRFYGQRPVDDGFTEKALLTPFDEGMRFPEYREKWNSMQHFEKCLYLWAEIHGYALDLEKRLGVPWLRVKFEDLFCENGINQLLDFLGLPRRPAIYEKAGHVFDAHSHRADHGWDIATIRNHPVIVNITKQLGYASLDVDVNGVRRRYSPVSE